MSHVKPGDIAKFIEPSENDGRQCYVEGPSRLGTENGELYWPVQLLCPVWGLLITSGQRVLFKPGQIVWARDKVLRRVDPPADDQETETVHRSCLMDE